MTENIKCLLCVKMFDCDRVRQKLPGGGGDSRQIRLRLRAGKTERRGGLIAVDR